MEKEDALDALHELSTVLETGLSRETLGIVMELTEAGVNPEAVAALIKELRRAKEQEGLA